ncbi:MAG TPA: SET domain-containing protein-lysine N-methyltransferase [Blastocatellia bacterium]|nr:SET domain-containing protein-lysine N-methyltransferase [Blastocatellia bacterium]
MKSKYAPGITVGPSKIDGNGCFATVPFRKGRKIAEYVGEKISRREIARRVKGQRRIYISNVDAYWAIDGRTHGNGTQFINHSCEPNCYLKILKGHLLFFALRDIEPGDEILLDYESSYHSDEKRCSCGAPSCRGRINN